MTKKNKKKLKLEFWLIHCQFCGEFNPSLVVYIFIRVIPWGENLMMIWSLEEISISLKNTESWDGQLYEFSPNHQTLEIKVNGFINELKIISSFEWTTCLYCWRILEPLYIDCSYDSCVFCEVRFINILSFHALRKLHSSWNKIIGILR